jgi:hypothetical protein
MLKYLRPILFVASALSLTACVNLWSLLFPPPPPQQQPGSFATAAINQYLCIPANEQPTNSIAAANMFSGHFTNAGWNQIAAQTDTQVTAGSLARNNVDMLFFQGHGDAGMTLMSYFNCGSQNPSQQAWGVGSTSGYISTGGARLQVTPSRNGIPFSGSIKWAFMYSSDTVAAPAGDDQGDPDWTAPWARYWEACTVCTEHGSIRIW